MGELAWNSSGNARRQLMIVLRSYVGGSKLPWEILEEPLEMQLPDRVNAIVCPTGIPRELKQLVIARCTIPEQEALLSVPFTSFFRPDIGDDQFQVHTSEMLEQYRQDLDALARMNKGLRDRSDTFRRILSKLFRKATEKN